jgi:hypothetical protein
MISAAGLTTACSGEQQQASTELPSASSTSAEPTPELPPLGPADFPVPDEARVKDEAGAEAFLQYYIDLFNRQIAVPDGRPLRELGPDCLECQRIAREFDQAAASKQAYEGGQITIDSDFGTAMTSEGANVSFFAQISAGRLRDPDGGIAHGSDFSSERLPSAALLTWSSSEQSWLVKAINFG